MDLLQCWPIRSCFSSPVVVAYQKWIYFVRLKETFTRPRFIPERRRALAAKKGGRGTVALNFVVTMDLGWYCIDLENHDFVRFWGKIHKAFYIIRSLDKYGTLLRTQNVGNRSGLLNVVFDNWLLSLGKLVAHPKLSPNLSSASLSLVFTHLYIVSYLLCTY